MARREQLVAILERQVARRDQIEERIRLIDLDLNRLNDERRALIH